MPKSKKSAKKTLPETIGKCEECGHEFLEKTRENPKGISFEEKLPVNCPKCHSNEIADLRIVEIKRKITVSDEDEDDDIETENIGTNDVIG